MSESKLAPTPGLALSELMAAAAGVVAAHDAHIAYSPTSYGLLMEIENLRVALNKVKS